MHLNIFCYLIYNFGIFAEKMPRRSITSTEKAAETTPVERRSTRASTRKSIEGTPDVAAPTPEKQKTEKSPAVKSSPAQSVKF